MRPLLLALVLAACAPKTDNAPLTFDEDFAGAPAAAPAPAATPAASAEAPPGPGLRTGTIARAHLVAVLDAGPGAFLRELEVTARLDGDRFTGWQLVRVIDRGGPLGGLDLAPGDVLVRLNGRSLATPDQLQAAWDALRTADELVAELDRRGARVTLRFAIDPPVGGAAVTTRP
jgi:hypothetical protein